MAEINEPRKESSKYLELKKGTLSHRIHAEMLAHIKDQQEGQYAGESGGWLTQVEQVLLAFQNRHNTQIHYLAAKEVFDRLPSLTESLSGQMKKEKWLDILKGLANPGYCMSAFTASALKGQYHAQSTGLQLSFLTLEDMQNIYDDATNTELMHHHTQNLLDRLNVSAQSVTNLEQLSDIDGQRFTYECLQFAEEETVTGNCLTSLADTLIAHSLGSLTFSPPKERRVFFEQIRGLRNEFRETLFALKVAIKNRLFSCNNPGQLSDYIVSSVEEMKETYRLIPTMYWDVLIWVIKKEPLLIETIYGEITNDFSFNYGALPQLLYEGLDLQKVLKRAGKKIETITYDQEKNAIFLSLSLKELGQHFDQDQGGLIFAYLKQKRMASDIFFQITLPLGDQAGLKESRLARFLARAKENSAKESATGNTIGSSEKLDQKKLLRAVGTERLLEFLTKENETLDQLNAGEKEQPLQRKQMLIDLFDTVIDEIEHAKASVQQHADRAFFTRKEASVIAFAKEILIQNSNSFQSIRSFSSPKEEIDNILGTLQQIATDDQKAELVQNTLPQIFTETEYNSDSARIAAEKIERGFVKIVSELFTRDDKNERYTHITLRNIGLQALTQRLSSVDTVIGEQHGWGASEKVFDEKNPKLLSKLNPNRRTAFFSFGQGGVHETNTVSLTREIKEHDTLSTIISIDELFFGKDTIKLRNKDIFQGYGQGLLITERVLGLHSGEKKLLNYGHSMGARTVSEKMMLIKSQHPDMLISTGAHADAIVLAGEKKKGYLSFLDIVDQDIIKERLHETKNLREKVRVVFAGLAAFLNRGTTDTENIIPPSVQNIITVLGSLTRIDRVMLNSLLRNLDTLTRDVHLQQSKYRESHLENQTSVIRHSDTFTESQGVILQDLAQTLQTFSMALHGRDQILDTAIGISEAQKIGAEIYMTDTPKQYQQIDFAHGIPTLLFSNTTHYGHGHEKGKEGLEVTENTLSILSMEFERILKNLDNVTAQEVESYQKELQREAYNKVFGEKKSLDKPDVVEPDILTA